MRNADETSDCLQIPVRARKKSTSHSSKVAQIKEEQMMQYMCKDAFFICSSQENCFLRRFLLLNTVDNIAKSQEKKTFRRIHGNQYNGAWLNRRVHGNICYYFILGIRLPVTVCNTSQEHIQSLNNSSVSQGELQDKATLQINERKAEPRITSVITLTIFLKAEKKKGAYFLITKAKFITCSTSK